MADKDRQDRIHRRTIGAAIVRLKWTSAPSRVLPHGALGLIGLSSGAAILGFVMAGSFAASRSLLLPVYLASQTGSAVAGGLMAHHSGKKYERIFRITACFQLTLLYHVWRFHEGRSPPGRWVDLAFAVGTVRPSCLVPHATCALPTDRLPPPRHALCPSPAAPRLYLITLCKLKRQSAYTSLLRRNY
jgi:hypothetical protein